MPPPPRSPQSRLTVQSQGEKMLLVPPPPLRFPLPPFCSPSLLRPSPMPPSVPMTLKVKVISHLLLSTSLSGAALLWCRLAPSLLLSQGRGHSRLCSTEGRVSLEWGRG